jgi:hypothetical protein
VGERLKESADCQLKSFLRLLSVAYDRWGYFFWLLVGRLVNRIVLLSSLLVKILSERGFACCGRPVLLLGFSPGVAASKVFRGILKKQLSTHPSYSGCVPSFRVYLKKVLPAIPMVARHFP